MIKVKPKLIYLCGCVARLDQQLEKNIARYKVINGEWSFKYDFDKNETIDWPDGKPYLIEFEGPFPDTNDYNSLIQFAQKALKDPTIVDSLIIDTGEPQTTQTKFIHTDEYYTVHGYYENGMKIFLCLRGYEPYDWSNYGSSATFTNFNDAKYYADRAPKQVVKVVIVKNVIKKITHVEKETSTVKYIPNHVDELITF